MREQPRDDGVVFLQRAEHEHVRGGRGGATGRERTKPATGAITKNASKGDAEPCTNSAGETHCYLGMGEDVETNGT